jgi:hypothetical protein
MDKVSHDQPGTKPHPYIPPGPVETAPYLGYCQPETRQAAFASVLQGVQLGAYDIRTVDWLVGWDDPTCRTIASLMWRCRLVGTARLAARLDGLRRLLAAVLDDEHRSRQLALEHAEAELADICAAGPVPAAGVTVSPAEASVIRQALAYAAGHRSARSSGCPDCAAAAGGCADHRDDASRAAAYEVVLRRLVTGTEVL